MKAFTQLILFFATLVTLLAQGTAMPILPLAIAELDTRVPTHQTRSSFFPPELEHSPDHFPTSPRYPPPTPPNSPTLYLLRDQPDNEKTNTNHDAAPDPRVEKHSFALIAAFALTPFAACIVLYPLFSWVARRRAASRLARNPPSEEKPKQLESPVSSYINNPRLAPLPAHPQMVYVPPTTKDGTRSIFGHFRSPSGGHVYGDADRWIMTEGGARALYGADLKGAPDPAQKLFVHPV